MWDDQGSLPAFSPWPAGVQFLFRKMHRSYIYPGWLGKFKPAQVLRHTCLLDKHSICCQIVNRVTMCIYRTKRARTLASNLLSDKQVFNHPNWKRLCNIGNTAKLCQRVSTWIYPEFTLLEFVWYPITEENGGDHLPCDWRHSLAFVPLILNKSPSGFFHLPFTFNF